MTKTRAQNASGSGARWGLWLALCLAAAAVVIRLVFLLYAQRDWEDALITVLHAENWWHGLGLTHVRPDGLRVHGFTSPISVLIPLAGGLIDLHGTYCLISIKVASVVAGGVTVYLLYRFYAAAAVPLAALLFAGGYLAFEHHQILWGVAGMETQVVTAVLFLFFYACAIRHATLIAVAMALALYARPDFVLLNIIAAVYVFVYLRDRLFYVLGLAALLYLPWFVFTFAYYGSPIPNTILAKAGYSFNADFIGRFLTTIGPLGPSFGGHGSSFLLLWDNKIIAIMASLLVLAGGALVVRNRAQAFYVPTAFVAVYFLYYLFVVPQIFGWYIVPCAGAAVALAGYGIGCLLPRGAVLLVGCGYAACFVTVLPLTFRAEKDIQRYIETPVRKVLGEFLRTQMTPQDWVGLEPLGYVSYYSRRPVMDYPGLANPDVVRFLHNAPPGAGVCEIIEGLKPKFFVLRPGLECRNKDWSSVATELARFKAPPQAWNILHAESNIDKEFVVYRRNDR